MTGVLGLGIVVALLVGFAAGLMVGTKHGQRLMEDKAKVEAELQNLKQTGKSL